MIWAIRGGNGVSDEDALEGISRSIPSLGSVLVAIGKHRISHQRSWSSLGPDFADPLY